MGAPLLVPSQPAVSHRADCGMLGPVEFRVQQIMTYPIRSLGGLVLDRGELTERGLVADRRWSVRAADGRVLGARDAPTMAEVRVLSAADPPLISLAGGVSGAAADRELSAFLGREVRIVQTARCAQEYAAEPVHLARSGPGDAPAGAGLVRANL
ncbi:MAG: MOSC N-terminal beta barrel domain-containing protein, partial [Angustibacter sp.]